MDPRAYTGFPWRKLVLTTDFSQSSLLAWNEVKKLISVENLTLTLLHVIEPAFQGLRIQTETAHHQMKDDALHRLHELSDEYFAGVSGLAIHVEEGRPASVICEVARQVGADLIVISSHGHSRFAQVLLGSVVENVVRESSCATLVIPARNYAA